MHRILTLTFILLVILPRHSTFALPAFPGAEGYGTDTVHGRGGTVIHVTNLNSYGVGSLREACEATGPRIVIFDVSGIIDLGTNRIRILNPYIYIAGQTAPGDGITIKNASLYVGTHDVLIRHIRSRPGDLSSGYYPTDNRDPMQVRGDYAAEGLDSQYNVVIDHCSFSWAIDMGLATWFRGLRDVTFSWNIISEGLWGSIHTNNMPHSRAVMIGDGARNMSIHHNYMAHNNRRNPLIKASTNVDVVNNLIYNPRQFASCVRMVAGYEMTVNFVKNFYKEGWNRANPRVFPTTPPGAVEWITPWQMDDMSTVPWTAGSGIYVEGDIGWVRTDDTMDQWAGVDTSIPVANRATVRYASAPITEHLAVDLEEVILPDVGATLPARDAIDLRVVNDFAAGTGVIIDSQSEVGGWVVVNSTDAPLDTDQDGMPDSWEIATGLDPNDAADNILDRTGDGYTNIEEYITSLEGSDTGGGCRDGACVEDPCGAGCATGETCIGDVCVVDECAPACQRGRICEDAECVDDPCIDIECPTDTVCSAGECVGGTTPEPREPTLVVGAGGGGCACDASGGDGSGPIPASSFLLSALVIFGIRRRSTRKRLSSMVSCPTVGSEG